MTTNPSSNRYGHVVRTHLSFDAALERAREALKAEGFGVLCEIDVAATLHDKLGQSFRPYRILGACNPHLAHQAIEIEPQLGLLLPCNVVVQEIEGHATVSVVDATAMLGFVGNDRLNPIAAEASARLDRVLARFTE